MQTPTWRAEKGKYGDQQTNIAISQQREKGRISGSDNTKYLTYALILYYFPNLASNIFVAFTSVNQRIQAFIQQHLPTAFQTVHTDVSRVASQLLVC